jgi:signal transduction histidine kinase
MPAPSSKARLELSGSELQSQRETLRRGLWRASVASVAILLVVVALTIAVVWKAGQSARETERARAATARAEAELWNAKLNQARARRIAGGPGARTENAALIRELVQRPDLNEDQLLALRQEAIAQMALVDVIPSTNWVPRRARLQWDGSLTRYVRTDSSPQINVHEYPSQRVLASFHHPSNSAARAAVLTPNGRLVAARFSGSDVLIWDVDSKKLFLKSRCERPLSVPLMFAPDNSALLMFTAGGLIIQPLDTNAAPRPLQPGRMVGNAVFTREARRLAVCPRNETGIIEIWDVVTGAIVQRFDAGFPVWNLEWHPDGRRLAIAGDYGRLGIWDTQPLQAGFATNADVCRETLPLNGHVGAITYTMFTPDGSFLRTHSWDNVSSVWDVVSGRRVLAETRVALYGYDFNGAVDRVLAHAGNDLAESVCTFNERTGFRTVAWAGKARPISGIFLSPNSRLLVIAHPRTDDAPEGECHLWDFQRGVELAQLPGTWAEFSKDSRELFTFEKHLLRRYALGSDPTRINREQIRSEIVYRADPGAYVNAGSLASDGRTMVIGSHTHAVFVDVTGEAPPRKFRGYVHDATLSPDGTLVGTRFQNRYGRLHNPTNGATIMEIRGVVEFTFSPDGKWIAGTGPDNVLLLARDSLKAVRKIPVQVGAGVVPPIAFTPDGSAMAVAHNRFDVQLIDILTGRQLATFSAPYPSQITASRGLRFTHDGNHLVACRADGEIVAWHLPTIRRELAHLGLDWEGAPRTLETTMTLAAPTSTRQFSVLFACLSAGLAGLAGLFVFLHQRQTISSYARVETMAVEQHTKLQTAQEQLLQSQKMRALGTLAAGVAHDFNNLLSVIRLSNQLAAEQTKPEGPARENIDAIESAVTEGENIVQSMLGYSRAAAELDHDYSVAAALSETVAMLGRKFLAGIILKLEVQPDLPSVHGARGRLEQMLLNLVVNASEAMNGQGTLCLSAFQVPKAADCILPPRDSVGYIEVQIGDSGPGIPADTLPRVFEPFFTTKTARARPGTGLGLATVYTMAQQDGFGLGVDTAEGRGTTFRILIPAGRNKPSAQSATNE